jgi:hypothetical protein
MPSNFNWVRSAFEGKVRNGEAAGEAGGALIGTGKTTGSEREPVPSIPSQVRQCSPGRRASCSKSPTNLKARCEVAEVGCDQIESCESPIDNREDLYVILLI